jgi:hypothetical protein
MAMSFTAPGVYVIEEAGGLRPIQAVGTSTPGFVGEAPGAEAFVNQPRAINNWTEFVKEFVPENTTSTPLSHAVYGYFLNGGQRCFVVNVGAGGSVAGGGRKRQGVDLLETIDEIAIVAAPGYTDAASYDAVLSHCENVKDRVAILDAPEDVDEIDALTRVARPVNGGGGGSGGGRSRGGASGGGASGGAGGGGASGGGGGASGGEGGGASEGGGSGGASGGGASPAGGGATPAAGGAAPASVAGGADPPGLRARQSDLGYGAFYFPWLRVRDPLGTEVVSVPPSGHMAGIWARTDATRGVHKAPANEPVRGGLDLTYNVTPAEQGILNQAGVNCIRMFSREGIRVWGARTVGDQSGEWRYLSVRRLFVMVEESIAEGTNWIVFEPNDQTLWKSIRRDIGAFLRVLWRDGALMGATPEEAFFVKCDAETNPPEVIAQGQVVTIIGMAPVKPAEFIVFRISQSAAGAEVESGGTTNG